MERSRTLQTPWPHLIEARGTDDPTKKPPRDKERKIGREPPKSTDDKQTVPTDPMAEVVRRAYTEGRTIIWEAPNEEPAT